MKIPGCEFQHEPYMSYLALTIFCCPPLCRRYGYKSALIP